jgi:glycosyltransferase involved in cell wall biosynthesis
MRIINEKMDAKFNIICFGFLPWSHMWKRNQSMMAEMSKWDFIHQLIFVSPTISVRTLLKGGHSHSHGSFRDAPKTFRTRMAPKISVYTPITFLPFKNTLPVLGKFENQITLKMIRHLNKRKPYILFMNCPNIASPEILDALLDQAALSFFDISDDFLELKLDPNAKEVFRQNLTKYAKAASIVLTVNEHVKNKYAHLNASMYVIRNGTNYDNFNRQIHKAIDALERLKQNKNPIIGYIGTANMGRIDSKLLDYLLEKRPNWQFVFVGPAHANFVERYAKYGNVHILGPVHYQELPCYIRYFNVAFVPFSKNENTKGNDLLKLHDFLAMGKPVVSTDIGGAKDLKEVIQVASTPFEFVEAIEKALHSDNDEDSVRRKSVALKNSWHNRIKEMEKMVREEINVNKR